MCGLGRSPAGCDLPVVAGLGRAEEKGRMWLSLPDFQQLRLGKNLEDGAGRVGDSVLTIFLGGGGSI